MHSAHFRKRNTIDPSLSHPMPLSLPSSRGHHRTRGPQPRFRRTGVCTVIAAASGIVCVFLLAFHGSWPITEGSSLRFPYLSTTTALKPSAGNIYDVYNDTLGVSLASTNLFGRNCSQTKVREDLPGIVARTYR